MRYCKTCQIHYDTDLIHCIFCNGELEIPEDDQTSYKFKPITKKRHLGFFFRLFVFLNFISIFLSLTIDYLTGMPISWSLVVSSTNVYVIAALFILLYPSFWASKFTKMMVATILVVILIGLSIREVSWAIDYVFPFTAMSVSLVLTALIISNRKRWFEYFPPLFISILVGLLPGLLILLKVAQVHWPSLVSFIYSAVTLLGIIFLPSKSSREEFKRRFHI